MVSRIIAAVLESGEWPEPELETNLLPAEVCRQKMHPKHLIQVVREGLALPQDSQA